MDWLGLVRWLAELPAVQGLCVALGTEAIKRAPVGPSGGLGIRLTAAGLALAATVASSLAEGRPLTGEDLGPKAAEFVSVLLAAVGAWQLSHKAGAALPKA